MQRFAFSGLDLRSLGAFRVVVGLNLIYNILRYRLFSIEGFYAGERIVPVEFTDRLFGNLPSLLDLTDSRAGTGLFFIVFLVVAALYTVGWRPKLSGALALICLLSTIHSNPFAAHGVESFIEVALFWGLFVPLGETFSLFPARPRTDRVEVRNLAAFMMLFQIALIYFTGAVTKDGAYWRDGIAIFAALDDRTHAGMLAGLLSGFPGLCRLLTYGSLVLELSIPLLIFSPFRPSLTRLIAAISIFWFHWLLATTLVVGPFFLITSALAIVLLPAAVWDRLAVDPGWNPPGARRIDHRVPTPAGGPRWLGPAVGVLLVVVMLHAVQKNMSRWHEHSYLSGLMRSIPPLHAVATVDLPRLGMSGIAEQPWWLFAPNPYEEMGTFVFVGMTDRGRLVDLLGGGELFRLDRRSGGLEVIGEPRNGFSGTRFVLSFYARRFLRVLPGEALERWTRYEYERWKRRNPDRTLRRAGLVYFSNATSYDGATISRDRSARFVGSYIPER